MTLADRIAVFMDGRIVQVGTPREIFARPMSVDVAGFIGTPPMNLLAGEWEGHAVSVAGSTLPVAFESAKPRNVVIGIRPGDLRLADGGLAVRVERVEDLGDSAIVNLKVGAQPLKLKTDRLPDLREGDDAFVDSP
jgi:multiple sugar transport system ATP-binding protein